MPGAATTASPPIWSPGCCSPIGPSPCRNVDQQLDAIAVEPAETENVVILADKISVGNLGLPIDIFVEDFPPGRSNDTYTVEDRVEMRLHVLRRMIRADAVNHAMNVAPAIADR